MKGLLVSVAVIVLIGAVFAGEPVAEVAAKSAEGAEGGEATGRQFFGAGLGGFQGGFGGYGHQGIRHPGFGFPGFGFGGNPYQFHPHHHGHNNFFRPPGSHSGLYGPFFGQGGYGYGGYYGFPGGFWG